MLNGVLTKLVVVGVAALTLLTVFIRSAWWRAAVVLPATGALLSIWLLVGASAQRHLARISVAAGGSPSNDCSLLVAEAARLRGVDRIFFLTLLLSLTFAAIVPRRHPR